MLCVYIEVVRVANDLLNCLEVEVGVTLVGASAPSAHYTHIYACSLYVLKSTPYMFSAVTTTAKLSEK
jgi:hypothetical protein